VKRLALLGLAAATVWLPACAREGAGEPVAEAGSAPAITQNASTGPAAVPLPPGAPRVDPGPVELLEITTAGGPVRFQVELADTDAERSQGLMWRGSMPADRGMLFDFPRPAPQAFWMSNTYIPLDILYIGDDGRIVSIAKNTQPLSEAPIPSGAPARGVLEINGGLSDRLGILPGDRVRHRLFP
jgi:uncharacterized membrane protein (UPF0127 family)